MNTTKNHTPGPWEHEKGSVSVFAKDGNKVCDTIWWNKTVPEAKANAALIAAAPDLLAACEHAANVFRAEIKDIDPRNELSRNDTPELAAAWHNLETMEKALTKSRTL